MDPPSDSAAATHTAVFFHGPGPERTSCEMPHSPPIVGGGDVVDALGVQRHRGRPRTPPELESSQSLDSPSAGSPLTPPRLTPGRGARFGAGSPRQRQLFSPFSPQKSTEGFSQPEDLDEEDGSFSASQGNYTHAPYEARPPDSRTILVDRLSELLDRLETGEALEDDALYTMHTQVDAMEGVLYIASKSKTPSIKSPSQRSAAYVDWQGRQGDGRGSFRSSGSSPAWARSGFSQQNSPSLSKPAASSHSVRERAQALGKAVNQPSMEDRSEEQCSPEPRTVAREEPKVSSKVVDQIVQEAETLRKDMAKVMKNLQRRREEADASASLYTF